jgi:hypothetical protein
MRRGIRYRVAASDVFKSPFFLKDVGLAIWEAKKSIHRWETVSQTALRHGDIDIGVIALTSGMASVPSSAPLWLPSSRTAVWSEATSSAARCDWLRLEVTRRPSELKFFKQNGLIETAIHAGSRCAAVVADAGGAYLVSGQGAARNRTIFFGTHSAPTAWPI